MPDSSSIQFVLAGGPTPPRCSATGLMPIAKYSAPGWPPSATAQRYRWLDPGVARQGWQNLSLRSDMVWGGEPAAHLWLDGYMLPEDFTLYTTASGAAVIQQLRLVPDAHGPVEVLRPVAGRTVNVAGHEPGTRIYQ